MEDNYILLMLHVRDRTVSVVDIGLTAEECKVRIAELEEEDRQDKNGTNVIYFAGHMF